MFLYSEEKHTFRRHLRVECNADKLLDELFLARWVLVSSHSRILKMTRDSFYVSGTLWGLFPER